LSQIRNYFVGGSNNNKCVETTTMQSNNKLRLAIRAAAIAGALSMAGQAGALTLDVGDDVEASLYGYARLNM
jgi:hypothetical protein